MANDIANKIRETYPHLVDRVPVGADDAHLPPGFFSTDISKFNKVFGTQWKTAWESVKETVDDILAYEKSCLDNL